MLPMAAAALGMFAAPVIGELFGNKQNTNPQILGGLPSAPTFTGQEIGAAVGGQQGFAGTQGMAQSGLGVGSEAYNGPGADDIISNLGKMNSSYADMAKQYQTTGANIQNYQNQANSTGLIAHLGNLFSTGHWNYSAPTPSTPS